MTRQTSPHTGGRFRTERRPGGAVFWLLLVMGLSTFAACIVLSEWRQYQAIQVTRQREQYRLDQLQHRVDTERRNLEALQTDPAVVTRIAQRDLGFHRPGQPSVAVQTAGRVAGLSTWHEPPFVATPVNPPEWVRRAGSVLPRFNYDAVFCEGGARSIVMVMSVALIVIAFALFGFTPTGSNVPRR